jgi:deoxyadenosine/deoxycytidine kinase
MEMQTTLYVIVGNIGSGKTTAFESVKEQVEERNPTQKVVFVDEGVDSSWQEYREKGETLLSCFYKNPKANALKMQLMATSEKIRQISKTIEENPGATIICERTHLCSYHVFRKLIAKHMTECEMKIYESVFASYPELKIDKIFYIDTPPDECARRIKKRGRAAEDEITLEYLIECDRLHHTWLDSCNNVIRLPFAQRIDVLKDKWYDIIINQPSRDLVYLSGKKSAGKTESAKHLISAHGYQEFAYADILKEIAILCGYSRELFYDKKEDPSEELMGHTPREFLQKLGSVLRSEMGKFTPSGNIIIDALNKKIQKFKGNVVVSDARFPNEVSDQGLVIKIERPGLTSTDMDVTETSVDQIQGDITLVNDYTVVALRQCLTEIVTADKIRNRTIKTSKRHLVPSPIAIEYPSPQSSAFPPPLPMHISPLSPHSPVVNSPDASPTSKYGSLEDNMLIFGGKDAFHYMSEMEPNVIISINDTKSGRNDVVSCQKKVASDGRLIDNYTFYANDRSGQLIPHFAKISELINDYLNKDMRVFVHCTHGISRSCACIIHFLMHYRGMDFDAAKKLVSETRPEACLCMTYAIELDKKLIEKSPLTIDLLPSN